MSTPSTTASEIDNEGCFGVERQSNIHKLGTSEIAMALNQAPCKTLKLPPAPQPHFPQPCGGGSC
jgi:hypothetical protein